MITINDQKSRLHLVACNRNQRFALHFYVILCHISCHFMLHCTSFHVAFHVILRHISHILLYASHASHAYHACRTFCISWTAHISCIVPHSTSFYVSFHVILSWKFIAYSFMPFRIEERRNRVKTPNSSIGRHLNEVF